MVNDAHAPGRHAGRGTPARRQRPQQYRVRDNVAPKDGATTGMFALGNVDQTLHTVGGAGQPGAIHVAVDPWR